LVDIDLGNFHDTIAVLDLVRRKEDELSRESL
jgi:hypothetical protein